MFQFNQFSLKRSFLELSHLFSSAFVSLTFERVLLLQRGCFALAIVEEGLAEIGHKLAIVKHLANLHRCEYFLTTFTLLALNAGLDKLRCQQVCPVFSFL